MTIAWEVRGKQRKHTIDHDQTLESTYKTLVLFS